MQRKGLATALVAGAALLMAGAASAQVDSLLDGVFDAADDYNQRIFSRTEVLADAIDHMGVGDNHNNVDVYAICQASSGERIMFRVDAEHRPSRMVISETKAIIEKNNREELADVTATLPGSCGLGLDPDVCFFDADCEEGIDCIGPGTCEVGVAAGGLGGAGDPCWDISDCVSVIVRDRETQSCPGGIEQLDCERARVKSTVNDKNDQINWQANARKCSGVSSPITAAIGAACGKAGDNKGISIGVKDNQIRNLTINGKAKNAVKPN